MLPLVSPHAEDPRALTIRPLTPANFAPFGEVIELSRDAHRLPINGGSCVRHSDLARPIAIESGVVSISLFDATATRMPTTLQMLERHLLGSQTFAPFGASLHALLVVADARLSPEQLSPHHLRAFITNGRQGFHFRPGVWHHPLLSLDSGPWLVTDRVADTLDCEVVDIVHWAVGVSNDSRVSPDDRLCRVP